MKILNNKHCYKEDSKFGDLSEFKYTKFLEKYNKDNNKNKIILRLGYTTTLDEVIKTLEKEYEITFNVMKAITDKILNNYNRLIELYRQNWELVNRFRIVERTDLFELLEKKLKIKNNKLNYNLIVQTLGIDIIEVNLDNNEIKFIEVKAFTVINKMYKKLGIEYWSNFNNKTLGFTFSMLCDEVVYAQDIKEDINKNNKKENLIKINEGREKEDFDVETIYNIFDYFIYLEVTIKEVNKFKNNNIYFIISKTNNTFSNFLLIDYNKFEKVKPSIKYFYTKDKEYLEYI